MKTISNTLNPLGLKITLDPVVEIVPVRVVEMIPVRVVEIVLVRLVPVVEMVPVFVVEIVPALVVEIVPGLENAVVDNATTRIPTKAIGLSCFMDLLLVFLNFRDNWVGSRILPLSLSLGRL